MNIQTSRCPTLGCGKICTYDADVSDVVLCNECEHTFQVRKGAKALPPEEPQAADAIICPYCRTKHSPGILTCEAMIREGDHDLPLGQIGDAPEAAAAPAPTRSAGCLHIRVEGIEVQFQVGNKFKCKPAFKAELRNQHGVLLADCVCGHEQTAVKAVVNAGIAVWRGTST